MHLISVFSHATIVVGVSLAVLHRIQVPAYVACGTRALMLANSGFRANIPFMLIVEQSVMRSTQHSMRI
jgi:hypothetical protein